MKLKARLKRWLGVTQIEWAVTAYTEDSGKDIAAVGLAVTHLESRVEELEQQRPISSAELSKRLNIEGGYKPWKRAK